MLDSFQRGAGRHDNMCALVELDLSSSGFMPTDVEALLDAISEIPSLTDLNLTNNPLEIHGANQVVKFFHQPRQHSLRTLCGIGKGARNVAWWDSEKPPDMILLAASIEHPSVASSLSSVMLRGNGPIQGRATSAGEEYEKYGGTVAERICWLERFVQIANECCRDYQY